MCILGHLVDVLCKDVIFSRVNKKGLPESFLLCAHLCVFVLQNHTDIHVFPQMLSFHFTHTQSQFARRLAKVAALEGVDYCPHFTAAYKLILLLC